MSASRRAFRALAALAVSRRPLSAGLSPANSAGKAKASADRKPVARCYGAAASSLDPRVSRAPFDIFKRGGNAADAAIAAAAMFSVGLLDGSVGGGFTKYSVCTRSARSRTTTCTTPRRSAMSLRTPLPDGRLTAVTQPERCFGGGGSAMVVCPLKKENPSIAMCPWTLAPTVPGQRSRMGTGMNSECEM